MLYRVRYVAQGDNCQRCGKRIKKVFQLDNGGVYGSECVNHVLGSISTAELEVPPWVLAYAESYLHKRLDMSDKLKAPLENKEDFAANFYNLGSALLGVEMKLFDSKGDSLVSNGQAIKINGRSVKSSWCRYLEHYLMSRRLDLP